MVVVDGGGGFWVMAYINRCVVSGGVVLLKP